MQADQICYQRLTRRTWKRWREVYLEQLEACLRALETVNRVVRRIFHMGTARAYFKWKEMYKATLSVMASRSDPEWGSRLLVAVRLGQLEPFEACLSRIDFDPNETVERCHPPRRLRAQAEAILLDGTSLADTKVLIQQWWRYGRFRFKTDGGLANDALCRMNLHPSPGDTVLHLSVRCGRNMMVARLLEIGADANIRNSEGERARDIAPAEMEALFRQVPLRLRARCVQ